MVNLGIVNRRIEMGNQFINVEEILLAETADPVTSVGGTVGDHSRGVEVLDARV